MAAELVTVGTDIKYEKGVNGTRNPFKTFQPRKQAYLFRFSTFPENFPVGRTDETCSIYCRTEISGNFLLNGKLPSTSGTVMGNSFVLFDVTMEISPRQFHRGGNRSHTKGCFPVGNSHLFMGKTATAVPNMMDVKSRKNAV